MVGVIDRYQIVEYFSRLVKEAREQVYIISPYIKLPDFLNLDLENPESQRIGVYVICGKQRMDEALYNYFSDRRNVHIYFCKDLHSKIYMNDRYGIICSMNLYDYSIRNNIETGVYFTKGDKLYNQCRMKMNFILKESIQYSQNIRTPSSEKTCH